MEWRIVDLSDAPASLQCHNDQLYIQQGEERHQLPLEELGALIVSHPQVSFTHGVLKGVCAHGGAFIVCDEKRMPIGQLLPLVAHSTQTERFAAQIKVSVPLKKQLWCQIIRAKILAQAALLRIINDTDSGLARLALRVRSGDPSNVEGLAARKYWAALFGGGFSRIPGAEDPINSHLNYGYAILRSLVARSLCASGLHPSLGIHHHNRYDPFCLADDIMEPFRPVIDGVVLRLTVQFGRGAPVAKDTKKYLLTEFLAYKIRINREMRDPFDAISMTASSLAEVYTGERPKELGARKLVLPDSRYDSKK